MLLLKFDLEMLSFLLVMLGPITPHLAEEGWSLLASNKGLLCDQPWPKFDESLVVENIIKMPIQINGKKRGLVETKIDTSEENILKIIQNDEKINKYLDKITKKKKMCQKKKQKRRISTAAINIFALRTF